MYILSESTLTTLSPSTELTLREALSGIFGAISLASWVFLLIPQVLENYRNQSAEAVSLVFICIWLVGDVTNLLGGLWAGLVPTVIVIAIWFCIQDITLITQSLYYSIRNRRQQGRSLLEAARASLTGEDINADAAEAVARVRREQAQESQHRQHQSHEEEDDEDEQPLLKRTMSASGVKQHHSSTNYGTERPLSPAQLRSSMNSAMQQRRSSMANSSHLVKIIEEHDSRTGARLWFRNVAGFLGVWLVGAVCWFLAYKTGLWKPAALTPINEHAEPIAKGAQILGYISAAAYLGARIPQIVKNWREQSCEGLSLLFFMLSLSGNLTYGASILCHSTEHSYVIKNVPWLIGSLGTMVQDLTIFVQFHIYSSGAEQSVVG